MRAAWSRLIAAAGMVWALTAWSGTAAQTAAEPKPSTPQARAAAAHRGFLWTVEDGANRLYLFGTIHVGKPEFYPLRGAVHRALQDAAVVALEADVSDPLRNAEIVQRRAMYPEPEGLRKRLSAAAEKRLSTACERLGLPEQIAVQLKPFMLTLTLALFDAQRAGYDPNYAVEIYLANFARRHGKPVVEIEGLEAQLAVMDRLPEKEAVQMLGEMVEDVLSGRSRREIEELVSLWARGDYRALQAFARKALGRPGVGTAFVAKELLEKRNAGMGDKAEAYLKSGRTHFLAVGALHLVGESGLPAWFAARGYRVTQHNVR